MRTPLASLCVLALLVVACGSSSNDSPADAAQDRADASPVPADVVDATDVADVAPDAGAADVGGEAPFDAPDTSSASADCGVGGIARDGGCECAPGLASCRSGCSDTSRDPVNCGLCAHSCRGDETCRDGRCVPGADAATPSDVCASTTDPANCCGVDCPLRINGVRACVAGRCGFSCIVGFADCDGDAANGCEQGTATDPMNCGACGRACPSGRCVGGVCSTPCEVGCPAGTVCASSGACVACSFPMAVCGGRCVNIQTDGTNCGACGNVCPSVIAATIRCSVGVCAVVACPESLADCDGNVANGCETSLGSSANCGVCGRACPGDLSCLTGHVCGCSNLATNMCGDRCVRPDDPSNCGRCGNACRDQEFCDGIAGVCRACGLSSSGHQLTRCDNTCRDLLDDSDNCGACGVRCARGCFSGVCR